ncbi:hypothetical protein J437_LFUL015505 [Ladona fulva]|uniref:Elongator complex protein 4 n=1 Tax=Ladona fulva TaxID=123851 RepID=A0A8K0P6I7_LADFU|nr:hypothetical protein J437_LFUL015505 [Ladona fulva]
MLKKETSATNRQVGNTKVPLVRGSRLSLRNAQLLVSSGVCSLDNFIGKYEKISYITLRKDNKTKCLASSCLTGGGLPVGTLCCIEEDRFGIYSELLLKHYIAEGVLNGHHNFVASYGSEAEQMVETLPLPVNDGGTMMQGNQSNEQMKIAWRYENLQSKESSASYSQFGHIYDTSKFMDREKVSSAVKFWKFSNNSENSSGCSLSAHYLSLLTSIEKEIEAVGCKVESPSEKRNVVRIALCSIGSPLWSNQTDSKIDFGKSEAELLTFVYFLKALLRNSYAVCMITTPRLFKTAATLPRLRNVVDVGITLEAFADSDKEVNELYREYCGLLRFSKLFSINTIVPHSSESLDLAMKLKRKRFIIEKLCLAPELSGQSDSSSALGCTSSLLSSGKGTCSLDF